MIIKKVIPVFLLLFIFSFSYAQEPGMKKAVRTNVKKNDTPPNRVVQISSTTKKKESLYYWNDQIILEKITTEVIPSDYPKFNAKISKSQNLELIETWMKKNIHLVKDKYKAQYK